MTRCVDVSAAFSVFLSMWTQGQVHVLNAGQSIDLDCEFYAEEFSMFNNPVIWKKFQRQEQVEVNIMGNILPPFFSTGRFKVALTTNPPRYRLQLKITGWSSFGVILYLLYRRWTRVGGRPAFPYRRFSAVK